MLSEVFYTFLISSVCGIILVGVRLCYKSKCKEIECLCFKVIREVEIESPDETNSSKI